jgi:hypothetical protein
MRYRKINVELIVEADEADAVVAELNASFDRLEEKYAIFGGEIETLPFEHGERRKRSALRHTIDAGESVADALRSARKGVVTALRAVV